MRRRTGNNYSGPRYLFSTGTRKADTQATQATQAPVPPAPGHEHSCCPRCGVRLWPGEAFCLAHTREAD